MNRLIILVTASVLLVGSVIGCVSGQQKEYTDPRQDIEIGVGEQFIITLDSNPTTGYEWQADFDESLLGLVQDEFKPAKTEPGMAGVGGKQSFTFQGVKKGKTEVTLTYKRSWEEGFAEQKVFVISIK